MKTETQIAEENIKNYNEISDEIFDENGLMKEENNPDFQTKQKAYTRLLGSVIEHKASCERFLKFLESITNYYEANTKMEDLEQAIKLYEGVGI